MALLFQLLIVMLLVAGPALGDDFSAMLEDVNEHHPAIQAERQALEATKTGINEAYSGFLPTATAAYDKGKQRVQYNHLRRQFTGTRSQELTVSQPIFNGGGTIAQINAAYARSDGGTEHLKQVQQQVLMNAITAYVDVVEKQRILDMTQDNTEALVKHLSGTRKQFKAGELTITDVAQSEARLARARAGLHDAEAALENALAAYTRETGKKPYATVFPPLPVMLPTTEAEIVALLTAHPAMLEAQDNEKVAKYTVKQRIATVLPEVHIQGQLSSQDLASNPGVFSTNDRTAVVRVSIPLSYADYSHIGEAKDLYRRAKHQKDDVERDTLKSALTEWHNYVSAGKAIAEHEDAVKAGEKALASVRKEQIAGTRTVLDVLNEQDEFYITQVNLVRAQSRHRLSAYRLLAALGRLDQVLPGKS